jgi:hypothetical protein
VLVLENSANSVTGDMRRGDYGVPSNRANTVFHLRQQETGSKVPQKQLKTHSQQIEIRRKLKILEKNLREFKNTPTLALY